MSFHHLAYHVVKHGFTIEGVASDYGYDALIVTFAPNGEVENGTIFIQLKASDSIRRGPKPNTVRFVVEKRDLDMWGDEPFPVYLVVFDAAAERAYWVYFQKYLAEKKISASMLKTNTFTVTLSQRVNYQSAAAWRGDKAAILAQIKVDHA